MMQCKNSDDVLKAVKDNDVSFIQFWFTDVLGILKSFAITPSELEEAMSEGMGFDGSSIEGFARIEDQARCHHFPISPLAAQRKAGC
jgi:glutamine synthetase